MTKYFERLYTEWNWLKPCEREWLEDEQRYDMPEAKRPGRRVGMTKKEQRAAVSLEMTAACAMHGRPGRHSEEFWVDAGLAQGHAERAQ